MVGFKEGYLVSEALDKNPLIKIQNLVYRLFIKHFNIRGSKSEVFNNFHNIAGNLEPAELNEKRVLIIKDLNNNLDCGTLLFNAFENIIKELIGPDILVQKNCNLVIQPPNDPNPSELHRDAPANSPYEVVLWVPLVDCYRTKAMYVVDYDNTNKIYNDFVKKNDWETFEKKALGASKYIDVKFNQGLFFSTAILHGSNINKEKETRVSLNIRFKNLFSPSGLKNQMEYFKPLQVSDLVKIGADLEAKTLLKMK